MGSFGCSRNEMFSYLPKSYGSLDVKCDDLELKQRLENLLEIVYSKTKTIDGIALDWSEDDYKSFRGKLGKLRQNSFDFSYDVIIYYLGFSKSAIEAKLRKLDQELGIDYFTDEKKVIEKREEITQQDGSVKIKRKTEYVRVKHIFNTGDIIGFIDNVYSKINQFSGNYITNFHSKIKDKDINSQITDFNILLEQVQKRDDDVINSIVTPFYKWIEPISDTTMLSFVERGKDIIINMNEKALITSCHVLGESLGRDMRNYSADLSLRYRTNQLRKPRKY